MATNTWSAAGADNWSTDAAWSLGHVPLATEDVVFDATSVEDCTLNINSALLGNLTIADAYTGTFTHTDGVLLEFAGDIYVGTAVTFVATANSVLISKPAGAQALTTNGKTLGRFRRFGAAAGSITLQDPLAAFKFEIDTTGCFQGGHKITAGLIAIRAAATGTLDAEIEISSGTSYWQCGAGVVLGPNFFVTVLGDLTLACLDAASSFRLAIGAGHTCAFLQNASYTYNMAGHVAGDWDGGIVVSSNPGTAATIAAEAGMVVSNMTVTDINNGGAAIDASDGTNTDGGGNTGWNFTGGGATGSSVARQKSSTSVGVGIGV